MTDNSVAVLAGAGGGGLLSLSLDGCAAVTDALLPQLAAALPRLGALSLGECQALRCEGLAELAPLTALSRLDLSLCKHLSDEPSMASLVRARPPPSPPPEHTPVLLAAALPRALSRLFSSTVVQLNN